MTTDAPIEQLLDHLAMIREHLDDPDFQEEKRKGYLEFLNLIRLR
jgi:hypothetical protein